MNWKYGVTFTTSVDYYRGLFRTRYERLSIRHVLNNVANLVIL